MYKIFKEATVVQLIYRCKMGLTMTGLVGQDSAQHGLQPGLVGGLLCWVRFFFQFLVETSTRCFVWIRASHDCLYEQRDIIGSRPLQEDLKGLRDKMIIVAKQDIRGRWDSIFHLHNWKRGEKLIERFNYLHHGYGAF